MKVNKQKIFCILLFLLSISTIPIIRDTKLEKIFIYLSKFIGFYYIPLPKEKVSLFCYIDYIYFFYILFLFIMILSLLMSKNIIKIDYFDIIFYSLIFYVIFSNILVSPETNWHINYVMLFIVSQYFIMVQFFKSKESEIMVYNTLLDIALINAIFIIFYCLYLYNNSLYSIDKMLGRQIIIRPRGAGLDAVTVSIYLVIVLIILIEKKNYFSKFKKYSSFLLIPIALLLTFSRGYIILLFIYFFYKIIKIIASKKLLLKIIIAFILLIFISSFFNLFIIEILNKNISNLYSLIGNQERINKNILAFDLFLKNPILGVGTSYFLNYDTSTPHNFLLQIMCENGIVGLFLLIILAALVSFKLVKKNAIDETLKLVISILLVSMLYFTIYSSFPMLILFICLFALFRNQAIQN